MQQPSSRGPLLFGGDDGELCVIASPSHPMVIGDVIELPSGLQGELMSLRIVGVEGVSVRETFVMPITDDAAIGSSEYPPSSAAWVLRESADGAHLAGGVPSNVILVIERESERPGSIEAIQVEYKVKGAAYSAVGTTSYLLDDDCE